MSKNNQQEEVATMLIEAMEQNAAPWMRPWKISPLRPHNGISGHEYRGLNLVLLAFCPFDDPRYCTFKQAQESGWKIKKGSKSLLVKYAAKITKGKDGEEDEEAETFFINKWFRVFNFEQVEGAPSFEYSAEAANFDPLPKCEEVLKNADVELWESISSNKAFYELQGDSVCMPDRARFATAVDFYKTVFHEMGHATGAKHRLNREISGGRGSESYAFEELVAEITSFLVGRVVGCGSEPSSNNVSYLQSWIKGLKNDNNYIFKACRLADRAMRWILCPEERENLKSKAIK
jgi:antirestriction protein ArdC